MHFPSRISSSEHITRAKPQQMSKTKKIIIINASVDRVHSLKRDTSSHSLVELMFDFFFLPDSILPGRLLAYETIEYHFSLHFSANIFSLSLTTIYRYTVPGSGGIKM